MIANGSEPWYQSEHLSINELAWAFQLPADELSGRLRNAGYENTITDRFPFQIVYDVLAAQGYEPHRLLPAKIPGTRFLGGRA